MQFVAYTTGILTLVVIWLVYRVLAGTWNPWKLVEGADGRPSTSKLQWFLWTGVVVFSYAAIYSVRVSKCHFEAMSEIPRNLLIAMGLSLTTMAAAKGVTVAYQTSGQTTKKALDKEKAGKNVPGQVSGPSSIIKDDSGFPDLSKIQMMAWTVIALVSYLLRVGDEIGRELPKLPDIDPALMVLMGLGQGAYLGKKLVTTATPRLTGLSPGNGKRGKTEITIAGLSFSDESKGNLITIDGSPFDPGKGLVWKDTEIKFKVPTKLPSGKDLPAGRILIGVIVNGRESANTLPFTVTDG